MATSTSNATKNIAEDLDKADIDFTGDDTTVMSTLTENTNMASPLFKSPTGKNEHSGNSPMEVENNVGQAVKNLERKLQEVNVSSQQNNPANHNTNLTNPKNQHNNQQIIPASTTILTSTNPNDPTNQNNTLSIIPASTTEPTSHEDNSNQEQNEEFPPPKAVGPPTDTNSDSQQQTGDNHTNAG